MVIKRLLVNIGSNLSLVVVYLLLTFIMTPIYVQSLGEYDYGLWIMISSVIGYMGILDMGIRPAISRFAARYLAEDDQNALQILYSTAFLFLFLMGLLLAIIFILWGGIFPESITPDGSNSNIYTLLLLFIGCRLLISFPGYVAESYLEGFQEYALKNNIAIFFTIFSSISFIIFSGKYNGLFLIALITTIEICCKYILYMLMLFRSSRGKITFNINNYSPSYLKELLTFGMKSLVQGISTRIEYTTDALVVGLILGPAIVPFYSIPANLVGFVRTIIQSCTHAFMPLFSSLHAIDKHDDVKILYLTASKYTVGLIFPLLIGAMVVGGPFINIWIDPKYGKNADMIIVVLSFYILLGMIDPFKGRYLTAIGRHGFLAKVSPISAFLNFVLSLMLIQTHGLVGVALGSLIPMFIFAPIYTIYTCNNLNISPVTYIAKSILPALIPSFIMAVFIIYFRLNYGLSSFFKIFQCIMIGIVTYLPFFYIFSLKQEDKESLYNFFITKKIFKR